VRIARLFNGYIAELLFCLIAILLFCYPFFQFFSFSITAQAESICPDYGDAIDQLQNAIDECQKRLRMSLEATEPLVGELENIEKTLADLGAKLNAVSLAIEKKKTELVHFQTEITKNEKLLVHHKNLLEKRVRALYIRSFLENPLLAFFSGGKAADITRELALRRAASLEDKKVIATISAQIKDLGQDRQEAISLKASLEVQEERLSDSKKEFDEKATFYRETIEGARAYQEMVEAKIAELTARQKAILAARSGTFTTSVGEVPLADDPAARPDFDPGFRPAFAVFSFGAYTHRKGMSQYGALGRAQSGQSVEQILAAYFPGTHIKKDYSIMGSIVVEGFGSRSFEDEYMKRIYEVPNSWPKEVLKAQAVAARTYAVRRTSNGASSICATQSCQVYKDVNKGGLWEEAVAETRNWVLVDDSGNPASGYYSSTTGGYLETSGWDTVCGSSSCWTNGAYEKIAGSPWFYKGWYTEGYRNDSAKCGRSHPWLTQEEFSDILNAWVVRRKGTAEEVGRVLPLTINSCPVPGASGGEPYSIEEMRQKAESLGEVYTRVDSVSVSYSSDGFTAQVVMVTNRGRIEVSGSELKEIFNLRAPGYISIRSPLFNIEKK
jgi:peptidoglycan hydrolase-like amidase